MSNSEIIAASIINIFKGIAIVFGGAIIGAMLGAIRAPIIMGVFEDDKPTAGSKIRDIIDQAKDEL